MLNNPRIPMIRLISLVLPLLLLVQPSSYASDSIRQQLSTKFPSVKFTDVRPTTVEGIFEVQPEQGALMYTDASVSFLFTGGSLIDAKSKANLTQARTQQLQKISWNELQLNNAITIKRGDGSRKLAVFADPRCGFCKRFEADLAQINDVTVYLFLTPVLGEASTELAAKVWCASNQSEAWLDLMLKGQSPKNDGSCKTPLAKNVEFANTKRITGTPTTIWSNGIRRPGAMKLAELEQTLKSLAQ
jgi:thiol:disulfide interchange protein DsbC